MRQKQGDAARYCPCPSQHRGNPGFGCIRTIIGP